MPAIRRILVAIKDPQAARQPGVLKAAQLARAYGATLELFHALSTPLYVDPLFQADGGVVTLEQNMRQNILRRLETIADRLRLHTIKVGVSAEWDYPAHEAVIRRARGVKADLIVVSLHPGKHRAPWLFRLTDWETLRWSEIPVLVVKNSHAYRHPAVLAAVDPGRAHGKPAQLDQTIVAAGKSVAIALSGSLHAVHAYDRFPTSVAYDYPHPGGIERSLRAVTRHAQSRFRHALRSARIARSRQYLVAGDPADGIADAAQKCRASIAVMGVLSRTGISRLLFGDTAERTLDALNCDILIVKPPGFTSRVPKTVRGARVRAIVPPGMLGG
jgi:universal stress protein E